MPTIYITLHMRTGLHGWAFNVLLALNIGQSLYPTSLDTVPPNHLKKMTCPSSCARHMTKLTKFNHTQPSWLQSINQSINLSLSLSLSLSLCVQDPQTLPLSLCTRPTDPTGSSLSPLIKPPNPFLPQPSAHPSTLYPPPAKPPIFLSPSLFLLLIHPPNFSVWFKYLSKAQNFTTIYPLINLWEDKNFEIFTSIIRSSWSSIL